MDENDLTPDSRILVTGAPRSGTTVLGRIVAFSPQVSYLWEPFNLRFRAGIPDYYPYVGPSTRVEKRNVYNKIVVDTIHRKNLKANIEHAATDTTVIRIGKSLGINRNALHYWQAQLRYLIFRPSVLLCKDPIGVFLSRFLLTEHQFRIVGVIRHPAAVMDSRRKLGWRFDFDFWKQQQDFHIDFFNNICTQMENFDLQTYSVECGFHWLACYAFLLKLKEEFPTRVCIVRHEDLCTSPANTIQKVFEFCDLPLVDQVFSKASAITSGEQTEKKSKRLATLEARNATELVDKWKQTVSEADLTVLRRITGSIASVFYPEDHFWKLD